MSPKMSPMGAAPMPDPARLYLVTPVLDDAGPFAPLLTAALDDAAVDCVLLRLGPQDAEARRAVASALCPTVQARGAACLVADDAQLAALVEADGAHIMGVGAGLDAALRSLKPSRIVGAGGLATRDDAMVAGEAGVDYVLFGAPLIDGTVPPLDARVEHVGWWAEIFQVPCVAWAHDLDDVEPLAAAGADFIALSEVVWADPRGPAAALRDVGAVLAAVAARSTVAVGEP